MVYGQCDQSISSVSVGSHVPPASVMCVAITVHSLLVISWHPKPRIIRRQLLTKVCILFVVVGPPCLCSVKKNSLDICIENPILFFMGRTFQVFSLDFQMFLSWREGTLLLRILSSTYASVPPCVSTTLPRRVKWSTSSVHLAADKLL